MNINKSIDVVFINPSNPCGAVFTKKHQQKLVDICEQYKVIKIYYIKTLPNMSLSYHDDL